MPAWSTCLRSWVPAWFMCQRACVLVWFTCQRAKLAPTSHFYLPINVPTCHTACQFFNLPCQLVKDVPIFQTFFSRNAKKYSYNLLIYKIFYLILDIIVTHIICINIVHKNRIIAIFYTSCHNKESVKFSCIILFLF